MKGWNLKMSLPNHLCLVKSWLRFASQLQLAKLCFQTEIQLLINNLCKWVCHSLEILAVSSNQDIRIYKMPPYLCYRNFTLHSDCLGIVTIPEIYKYVSSYEKQAIFCIRDELKWKHVVLFRNSKCLMLAGLVTSQWSSSSANLSTTSTRDVDSLKMVGLEKM